MNRHGKNDQSHVQMIQLADSSRDSRYSADSVGELNPMREEHAHCSQPAVEGRCNSQSGLYGKGHTDTVSSPADTLKSRWFQRLGLLKPQSPPPDTYCLQHDHNYSDNAVLPNPSNPLK